MSTWGVLTALVFAVTKGSEDKDIVANHLRRSGGARRREQECLVCRIEAELVDYADRNMDHVMFECITDDYDAVEMYPDMVFDIDLPDEFAQAHWEELMSGYITICVPGGQALHTPGNVDANMVVYPEGADIRVIENDAPAAALEPAVIVGARNVLIVRVSGTTEQPSDSSDRLAGTFFGLGSRPFENSMSAQFDRCSFGQLTFAAARGFSQITNGVMELNLGYSLRGRNIRTVDDEAFAATSRALGVGNLGTVFDHVVLCVAGGTTDGVNGSTNWVGYARIRGWSSVFNAAWCDNLITQMHEIGHNLGLRHSGEQGDEYDDLTGMVRFVFRRSTR